WWSNFNVLELPEFDFETMRASAAATGTLDCQDVLITSYTYTPSLSCTGCGCNDPGANCSCSGSGAGRTCTGSGCGSCSCSGAGAGKTCSGGGGCNDCGSNCSCSGSGAAKVCTGSGCNICTCVASVTTTTVTSTEFRCCSSAYLGGPVTCNYPAGAGRDGSCVNCTMADLYDKTALRDMDYTWFWDQNASWTGRNGIRGTIVVTDDFSISGGDYYCQHIPGGCVVKVPPMAWQEYRKYDTTSANSEYPGDMPNRVSSNSATYTLGSNAGTSCSTTLPNDGGLSLITRGELWRVQCGSSGLGSDLGIYGFLYVGGDLYRGGDSDIYGSMWVEGDVGGADNTMVFYNSNLKLATLNVVLERNSWNEVQPSAAAW
ncbi:MAG TPA: hypothetical protein PL037_09130, partial [Elusimicrobiales bacterium]|nr:hypothetical protein [Elusimicrobiales bacterium]